MVSLRAVSRWVRVRVGWPTLAASVALGCLAGWLVTQAGQDGGPAWVLCILAVTSSLLLVRSVPLAAATLVFAGAVGGQVVVGPLVTCGVVLPVVAVLAYRLAARPLRPRPTVVAAGLLAGVLLAELLLDPVFAAPPGAPVDPSGPIFVFGFEGGVVIAGLVSRDRRRTLDRLRRKSEELVRQRELTAAAAVDADRAQVELDLDLAVRDHLRRITVATERGRRAWSRGDTPTTRKALAEIEGGGREVLAGMRAVVNNLERPSTEPPPGIAQLEGLVRRASAADVRLRVDGSVRPIGPHLELSVYRVVEYLLAAAGGGPEDRIEVRVTFEGAAVAVRLSAPVQTDRPDADRVGLDAARARAEVAGGRLQLAEHGLRRDVRVSLPVPAALIPVG